MAKDIAVDAKLCDALNALHCPNGDFLSAENVFAAAAEPSQSSYARMLSEFVRRGLHAKALALTCRGDSRSTYADALLRRQRSPQSERAMAAAQN